MIAERPIGVKRRKILLIIALSVDERGEAPPWSAMRNAIGVDRAKFQRLMGALRRDGLATWSGKPGSARVTPAGLEQALRKTRPRH